MKKKINSLQLLASGLYLATLLFIIILLWQSWNN